MKTLDAFQLFLRRCTPVRRPMCSVVATFAPSGKYASARLPVGGRGASDALGRRWLL